MNSLHSLPLGCCQQTGLEWGRGPLNRLTLARSKGNLPTLWVGLRELGLKEGSTLGMAPIGHSSILACKEIVL